MVEHDATGHYVEITCGDPTKFRLWNEVQFLDAVDMVVEAHRRFADGRFIKARCEDVCQSFGLRTTADGLLAGADLRGAFSVQQVCRYDWVHTLLSAGFLTTETWALISICEREGIWDQKSIASFLRSDWTTPQYHRGQGHWFFE